jgi:hypothetical protein
MVNRAIHFLRKLAQGEVRRKIQSLRFHQIQQAQLSGGMFRCKLMSYTELGRPKRVEWDQIDGRQ